MSLTEVRSESQTQYRSPPSGTAGEPQVGAGKASGADECTKKVLSFLISGFTLKSISHTRATSYYGSCCSQCQNVNVLCIQLLAFRITGTAIFDR